MNEIIMTKKPVHVVGIGGTYQNPSTSLAALKRSLTAAQAAGATTELLDLRALDLPMYRPGQTREKHDPVVGDFIASVRRADALLLSTAAYHGTLAGVTKNALDYLEALSADPRPYLDGRVVGLMATAGGDIAAINAINALVHVVHSLRGTVASLLVPIPKANRNIDGDLNKIGAPWDDKLESLGHLVVSMTRGSSVSPAPCNKNPFPDLSPSQGSYRLQDLNQAKEVTGLINFIRGTIRLLSQK